VEKLMKGIVAGTLALAALFAAPALAQDEMAKAKAVMKGVDGAELGTVTFTETPAGVLILAELTGLPPGVHGFHLHETGSCEPDFGAAGGHFNPSGAEHGFFTVGGPHAGDMPNIHVPDSGALTIEILMPSVTLKEGAPATLFDDDGTSLVIHAGADDYKSPPSGKSGDRIACGVVER
jgi:superoxide dismutase, Cu-Zn family